MLKEQSQNLELSQENITQQGGIEKMEKEKQSEIINEQCYKEMQKTIKRIRDAWKYAEKDRQKNMKKICELEGRKSEIFIDLIKGKGVDLTKGYTHLTDDIVGVDRPNSLEHKTMSREHRKFLDPDFVREFKQELNKEFKTVEREDQKGEKDIFYLKDGKEFLRENTIKMLKSNFGFQGYADERLTQKQREYRDGGLHNPEFQLGYELEKYLGGKGVNLSIGNNITMTICESIKYDSDAKKYSIDPKTKINDIVGRLRVSENEIPKIIGDSKESEEYYKE